LCRPLQRWREFRYVQVPRGAAVARA